MSFWETSRAYRMVFELVVYSIAFLGALIYVLSNVELDPAYRLYGINPVYIVGPLAGGVGGAVRGLLGFWKRKEHQLEKVDYWQYALPFYIGIVFGFFMTLILQSGLKVIGVPSTIGDAGGLSFIALICALSGLYSEAAERKFEKSFEKNK